MISYNYYHESLVKVIHGSVVLYVHHRRVCVYQYQVLANQFVTNIASGVTVVLTPGTLVSMHVSQFLKKPKSKLNSYMFCKPTVFS